MHATIAVCSRESTRQPHIRLDVAVGPINRSRGMNIAGRSIPLGLGAHRLRPKKNRTRGDWAKEMGKEAKIGVSSLAFCVWK
jgi:hypothetical protein